MRLDGHGHVARPVVLCLAVLLLAPAGGARGDGGELGRRAFLGAGVAENPGGGLSVTRIIEGSTAAALGLIPGDVILNVDGRPAPAPSDFVALVGSRRPGDALHLTLLREGERLALSGALVPYPPESVEGSAVRYGHLTLPGGDRLRTILTVPAGGGSFPAVLFIQGLSCASIDRPFATRDDTWTGLVHQVAAAGVITARVEKSGVGDSEGPPCSEIDFNTELAGYRAGLAALAATEQADPDRVFLFGLSMGGVMAPLVATGDEAPPVRGVAVYGTILKSFLEYLVENRRRQVPRDALPPLAAEQAVRGYQEFMARFLLDRLTPAQVLDRAPHLAGAVENTDDTHFFGRHASFYHQLQEARLPEAWSKVAGHVLALHGQYDWVSAEEDHRGIAALVNAAGPGRGRFVSMPGLDHGFTEHASLEESYASYTRGQVNDRVGRVLLAWMAQVNGG